LIIIQIIINAKGLSFIELIDLEPVYDLAPHQGEFSRV